MNHEYWEEFEKEEAITLYSIQQHEEQEYDIWNEYRCCVGVGCNYCLMVS